MFVMPEPCAVVVSQQTIKHFLADVTERGVSKVVTKTDGLGQILVESEGSGHTSADLSDLKCVGQTGSIVIAERRDEHLRLVLQAAEGLAVNDPVPVPLKGSPKSTGEFRSLPILGIGTNCLRRKRHLLEISHSFLEAVGYPPSWVTHFLDPFTDT
jgi:hypothetical protein